MNRSDPSPRSNSDWRQSLRETGPYMGLGMQMALSMAFFVGLGYAADRWLGTLPGLTIAGSVVGMVAVGFLLRRVLRELSAPSSPPASRPRAGAEREQPHKGDGAKGQKRAR